MTGERTHRTSAQKVNVTLQINILRYQLFVPGCVVDVNTRRKDHWTPLHLASHCGRPEVARLLLDYGANPKAEDNLLRTPLHHVARGHYESQDDGVRVSQLLLDCGADINAQDINRETPLHLASSSGKPEIVWLLLQYATTNHYRGQSPSQPGLEGEKFPKG